MSWPVDNAVHIFKSITDWLEKNIKITSELHIMAPQTNIEPILVVEIGGASGKSIEKAPFNYTEQNNPTLTYPNQPHNDGQWVFIPVVISLELSGTQGDVFAGRALLASICTTRYLYEGAVITIPISSTDFTRTNIATGEDVTFTIQGLDGALFINEVDDGISFKYEDPNENGGNEFKFIQTFTGRFRIKVSEEVYQDMRLNNDN